MSLLPSRPRILVLGGSSEGFEVAAKLVARGFDVETSFAGRTMRRRAPEGRVRVGGFGGAGGLSDHLRAQEIALMVDATHPFAALMKANAAAASNATGVPLIHVERAAWAAQPGDDWRMAHDVGTAARLAPVADGSCFVTVGRQELAPFAARTDLALVVRVIDLPDAPFPHPRTTYVAARGPFAADDERRLFDRFDIRCVVAKNSGGPGAEAKLFVARERGLPVVMVERPPRPEGMTVGSPDEATEMAAAMLGFSAS